MFTLKQLGSSEFIAQELDSNGEVVKTRHLGHNIIVESASILIAQLIKQQVSGDFVPGFTHFAVGDGDFDWDKFDPPLAQPDQTSLVVERFRKPFEEVKYIKTDGSGEESTVPTNIIDFIVVFNESEAVGPLVEMGIFGGIGADHPGGGIMVNARNFPVWNKPAGSRLRLIVRLTT